MSSNKQHPITYLGEPVNAHILGKATTVGTSPLPPAVVAILHPLLLPESLENRGGGENHVGQQQQQHKATQQQQNVMAVRMQPKITMLEWPSSSSNDQSNSADNNNYITFMGEYSPSFVKTNSSSAPQNTACIQKKPVEALHPLRAKSLAALVTALLSGGERPSISLKTLSQRIFDGDKGMARLLMASSSTAADSSPASSSSDATAAINRINPFRQLIEDLGAAPASSSSALQRNSADATGAPPSSTSSTPNTTTGNTMARLLQWALFLSSPAGHVTPMAFLEGKWAVKTTNVSDEIESFLNFNVSVTPQQLKDKLFELQIRFYVFIDERCFLACHVPVASAATPTQQTMAASSSLTSPSSVSAAASGAPTVLASIAARTLTNIIKQQKATVLDASTSVHGLLPFIPLFQNNCSGEASTVIGSVLNLIREAAASSGATSRKGKKEVENDDIDIDVDDIFGNDDDDGKEDKEESDDDEDDDEDDNISFVGSAVSGVSGINQNNGSGGVKKIFVTQKKFTKLVGTREENEKKCRAVTLIAAFNFARLFTLFLKFIPTDGIQKLQKLAADPALGNSALFTTVGLVTADDEGGLDWSWLTAVLLSDAMFKTVIADVLLSFCPASTATEAIASSSSSSTPQEASSLSLSSRVALESALLKAASDLPALRQEHRDLNPQQGAVNPDSYANETAFAKSQRPIPNFLETIFNLVLEGRKGEECDDADDNDQRARKLLGFDLTLSGGNINTKSSSLDIMVIRNKSGTSATTTAGGSIVNGEEANNNKNNTAISSSSSSFTMASRIEVLQKYFLESVNRKNAAKSSSNSKENDAKYDSNQRVLMILKEIIRASISTVPANGNQQVVEKSVGGKLGGKRPREEEADGAHHRNLINGNNSMPASSSAASTATTKAKHVELSDRASEQKSNGDNSKTSPHLVLKLFRMEDLPFKVRFDWSPFYENPTPLLKIGQGRAEAEAPAKNNNKPKTSSTAAGEVSFTTPIWAKTSQIEHSVLEGLIDVAQILAGCGTCGLEFCFHDAGEVEIANEQKHKSNNKNDNSKRQIISLLQMFELYAPSVVSGGGKTQNNNAIVKNIPILLDVLSSSIEGARLATNLSVRRYNSTTVASSQKSDSNAAAKGATNENSGNKMGVVRYVLSHSDATLRSKFGGGNNSNSSEVTHQDSINPNAIAILNNGERNVEKGAADARADPNGHQKFSAPISATAPYSECAARLYQSFLHPTKAHIASLTKRRDALVRFANNARRTLDEYEALALQIGEFLRAEVQRAGAGGESAATANAAVALTIMSPVSFEEAQRSPLGLIATGFGGWRSAAAAERTFVVRTHHQNGLPSQSQNGLPSQNGLQSQSQNGLPSQNGLQSQSQNGLQSQNEQAIESSSSEVAIPITDTDAKNNTTAGSSLDSKAKLILVCTDATVSKAIREGGTHTDVTSNNAESFSSPTPAAILSCTCLTPALLADLAAFAYSNEKRSRRLRGLCRMAEEAAKVASAALLNLTEDMWLWAA